MPPSIPSFDFEFAPSTSTQAVAGVIASSQPTLQWLPENEECPSLDVLIREARQPVPARQGKQTIDLTSCESSLLFDVHSPPVNRIIRSRPRPRPRHSASVASCSSTHASSSSLTTACSSTNEGFSAASSSAIPPSSLMNPILASRAPESLNLEKANHLEARLLGLVNSKHGEPTVITDGKGKARQHGTCSDVGTVKSCTNIGARKLARTSSAMEIDSLTDSSPKAGSLVRLMDIDEDCPSFLDVVQSKAKQKPSSMDTSYPIITSSAPLRPQSINKPLTRSASMPSRGTSRMSSASRILAINSMNSVSSDAPAMDVDENLSEYEKTRPPAIVEDDEEDEGAASLNLNRRLPNAASALATRRTAEISKALAQTEVWPHETQGASQAHSSTILSQPFRPPLASTPSHARLRNSNKVRHDTKLNHGGAPAPPADSISVSMRSHSLQDAATTYRAAPPVLGMRRSAASAVSFGKAAVELQGKQKSFRVPFLNGGVGSVAVPKPSPVLPPASDAPPIMKPVSVPSSQVNKLPTNGKLDSKSLMPQAEQDDPDSSYDLPMEFGSDELNAIMSTYD